jgi:AI-2 transport protein TqsA
VNVEVTGSSSTDLSVQPTATGVPGPGKAVGQAPGWHDRLGLATVAASLVVAALGWYLLKEFAPLLRPFLLAVFFCYVVYPTHRRLTRHVPASVSLLLLAGASAAVLVLLGLQGVGSASRLSDEMPQMIDRARAIINQVEGYYKAHLPPWLDVEISDLSRGETASVGRFQQIATGLAAEAAHTVSDAALVGIYLLFLLLEAGRVPGRIQAAFSRSGAEQILVVVANINSAMAGYLRVKVKASLVLAVPATAVLWAFGVKSAVLWGVLTFLLNFIPYLGSVIACAAPILLAILQTDSLTRPAVLALTLIGIHTLSAYFVEPAMTGKAVNLSPVVILVSLSFWWLCWGFTGMILAVPLTVLLKIILENIASTRPLARLLAEE